VETRTNAPLVASVLEGRPPAWSLGAPPVLDGGGRLEAYLVDFSGRRHPVRTFVLGVASTYVALAALSILLGLLVTHVLVASGWLASADESVVAGLVRHRSPVLTDASLVGSVVAGGVVLPIVAGVWALMLGLARQWRLAAFLPFGLGVESAVYRTTTLVVHRDRPDVHRLEHLPVDASYPSGHTAAAIVVYCGIALLVASRTGNSFARRLIWLVALMIPAFVAWSRMYRGMHHPLDVAGGVVIGVVTLVAMVSISRASGRAARRREASEVAA
jgi:membrane-associated phospholipid phosphatase